METYANPKLRSSLATGIVLGAGAVVAMAVAAAPAGVLAPLIEATGLPGLVPAAAPPLGTTARTLLALAIGGVVSALLWGVLRFDPRRLRLPGFEFPGRRRLAAQRSVQAKEAVPVLRRADAHPDAPARRPIHASVDLGTPLPIAPQDKVAVERPLAAPGDQTIPADLDQPLAAFDPAAIPDAPMTPVRPVAPLAPVVPLVIVPPVTETEPIAVEPDAELIASAPVAHAEPIMRVVAPPASPEPEMAKPSEPDSLESLVARLERATRPREKPVATKPAVVPAVASDEASSIEDTLGMLRRLAAG